MEIFLCINLLTVNCFWILKKYEIFRLFRIKIRIIIIIIGHRG